MLKTFTLLSFVFAFFAITAVAQVNLSLGLVANYPMNNSPLDATSNHLDLTIHNSPAGTPDRYGNATGAYLLTSSHPDYFTAAINALLAPTEVTLAAWVKLPNAVPDQKIAGRAVVGGGYLLGVDSNKLDAEIWDLSSVHYRLKANTVPNNTWTHLAMSYKANEYLRVYINGVPVDSIVAGTTGVGTTATWTFTVGGAPWQPAALNANGSFDDIFVYNRAINAAEVAALFNLVTSTIDDEQTVNLTSVYPVPLHQNNLSVDFRNNVTGKVRITISDISGRNVYTNEMTNPKKELIDVSRLQPGIYSISFLNENKTETHKIVIQ
ncbi:MAG: T9SS type A sorting domain-containing protein [Bacteroidetes bacterium]|nr:T9SS type A sorting domain-containing protein [Bacteroidota bacterium]